jgi:hypothetical protein
MRGRGWVVGPPNSFQRPAAILPICWSLLGSFDARALLGYGPAIFISTTRGAPTGVLVMIRFLDARARLCCEPAKFISPSRGAPTNTLCSFDMRARLRCWTNRFIPPPRGAPTGVLVIILFVRNPGAAALWVYQIQCNAPRRPYHRYIKNRGRAWLKARPLWRKGIF